MVPHSGEQSGGGADSSRRRRPRRLTALVAALSAAIVALTTADVVAVAARQTRPVRVKTVTCSNPPAPSGRAGAAQGLAQAAAAVAPSVVAIRAVDPARTVDGSGIVLRSDGIILTNNHVVAGVAAYGGTITATAADGRSASVDIVGASPQHDVAVVRAHDLEDLRPAQLGSAGDLHVGDQVLAIGSALGLKGSVTSGIVSALGREVCFDPTASSGADQGIVTESPLPSQLDLKDLIQTDAPINEGNSGGALVDAAGKVVGMCTAYQSPAGGSVGIGFAIRIDSAYTLARQLLAEAGVTL